MRILPFTDALAPAFHDISAGWIGEMFALEDNDRHVLSHPREAIVDRGGTILFVEADDGAVVAAGALMPTAPGMVELTKMGVRPGTRGGGVGAMLLTALIAHARAMPGLETLYLLTSSRCEAAIHLYTRAGFVHDAGIMARFGGDYARCDVAMRLPP